MKKFKSAISVIVTFALLMTNLAGLKIETANAAMSNLVFGSTGATVGTWLQPGETIATFQISPAVSETGYFICMNFPTGSGIHTEEMIGTDFVVRQNGGVVGPASVNVSWAPTICLQMITAFDADSAISLSLSDSASGNEIQLPTTATDSGTFSINATYLGNDLSVSNVSLVPGAATQVRVENASDGTGEVVPEQSIYIGGSLTAYAIRRDQYGNFVDNTNSGTWSLSGDLSASDLVPDDGNAFAILSGSEYGSAVIKFTKEGLTSVDSGVITVEDVIPPPGDDDSDPPPGDDDTGPIYYNLGYSAGDHGSISPVENSIQVVEEGGLGVTITAVPDVGYHFVNWSDESTQNPRTDDMVGNDISVTASFAPNFDGDHAGTAQDPYRISICQGLQDINLHLSSYYVLTDDIDCGADTTEGGALWNGGEGFTPITNFTGHLNGDGFTIQNLHINRPASDPVGLFAISSGVISNLGLVDVAITGNNNVGALIGNMTGGALSSVFATGTVASNWNVVGGLVGYQSGSGAAISNAYSKVNVDAGYSANESNNGGQHSYNGGIAGYSSGSIINTYYNGTIANVGGGNDPNYSDNGGIVGGTNNDGLGHGIFSSYYHCGEATDVCTPGIGSTGNLGDPSLFSGWNFVKIWNTPDEGGPVLRKIHEISSCDQLQAIGATYGEQGASDVYKLMGNIDCSGVANFSPILFGEGLAFSGVLDGNGNTISNLNINSGRVSVGMFALGGTPTFLDLTLDGGTVAGSAGGALVGALVGDTDGITIDNVSSNVDVSAIQTAGGLIGRINNGGTTLSITGASVSGDVESGAFAGGLIGVNVITNNMTISESNVSGNVTGGGYTGGFIGALLVNNDGPFNITKSYLDAAATVHGSARTGGFIGSAVINLTDGSVDISESYSAGTVVCTGGNVGGFVGQLEKMGSGVSTTGLTVSDSYSVSDVTGPQYVGGILGVDFSVGSNLSRVYFAGSVSDTGDASSFTGLGDYYGPSFGGIYGRNEAGLESVTDSFVAGTKGSAGGVFGWLSGYSEGGAASGFAYYPSSAGLPCVGYHGNSLSCAEHANLSYFKAGDFSESAPMSSWTFGTGTPIWDAAAGSFPTLHAIAADDAQIIFISPTPSSGAVLESDSVEISVQTFNEAQHYVLNNIDNSLLGWWRFENGAQDEFDVNNGVVNGATSVPGKFGDAYDFGNLGSTSIVAESTNLEFEDGDAHTISAWVKLPSARTTGGYILTLGNRAYNNGQHDEFLKLNGTIPSFVSVGDGGNTWVDCQATSGMSLDEWHHLVGVNSGNDFTLYVDGEQAMSCPLGSLASAGVSSTYLAMGQDGYNWHEYFHGLIDDVAIFNRALSGDEVASMYDAAEDQYDNSFTGLVGGAHTIQAYAIDLYGNKYSTEQRAFTTPIPPAPFANADEEGVDGSDAQHAYAIANCEQLQAISGSNGVYLNKYFKLVPEQGTNIDCSATATWNRIIYSADGESSLHIGIGDGEQTTFNIGVKDVDDVIVYVDNNSLEDGVTVDESAGTVTFDDPPGVEASIDVDFSHYQGFDPIGCGPTNHRSCGDRDEEAVFTGHFDGNGNTVSGLYVNRNEDYLGLFGSVGTNAVIENVGIVNADISAYLLDNWRLAVGALAGYVVTDATVNNTYSTGSVSGVKLVGGLVGSHAYDPTNECFLGGTKILMADSSKKNIEDVAVGDMVYSYNEATNSLVESSVDQTFVHDIKSYLVINNRLRVTANHPLYVNGQWKQAGDVKIGDVLLDENMNNITVDSIDQFVKNDKVYNFEVKPLGESDGSCGPGHSYFADGILAHNKCLRVFTDNGKGYQFNSLLNVNHMKTDDGRVFRYPLQDFESSVVRVDYDPNEIGYLDFVQVDAIDSPVNGGEKITTTLKPKTCASNNCDLSLLLNDDNKYLIFDENNKEITIDFGALPPLRQNYTRSYEIVSGGYQEIIHPFSFEDYPSYIQEWFKGYNQYMNGGRHHTIQGSYSQCTVSGQDRVGGLVGVNDGHVVGSHATGAVSGESSIGGLVGLDGDSITLSYATGAVTGQYNVGGLVGEVGGHIDQTYSTGNVSGLVSVGGFAGNVQGASVIEDSYSTGDVGLFIADETPAMIGGFVGQSSGDIHTSYSSGDVTVAAGTDTVGGFIGRNGGDSVYSSFSIGRVNGTAFGENNGDHSVGVFAGLNFPAYGYGIYNSGVLVQGTDLNIGSESSDSESLDPSQWPTNLHAESDVSAFYDSSNDVYDAGDYVWDFAEAPIWDIHADALPTLHAITADDPIYLSDWDNREMINIDHTNVDATLTDFPLLVRITEGSDLSEAMSNAMANGYDIRFTLSDGTTLLPYERDGWSGGDGDPVVGNFWVKVPSISHTSNTRIYMYWGNEAARDGQDATNVWDSNYAAVYHDPSNLTDSTSNNNDCTNHGEEEGVVSDVDGEIGGAAIFDRNLATYLDCGNGDSLTFSTGLTTEMWAKPTTSTGGWFTMLGKDGYGNDTEAGKGWLNVLFGNLGAPQKLWYLSLIGNNGNYTDTFTNSTETPPAATWTHLVSSNNSGTVTLYNNGVADNYVSNDQPITNAAVSLFMGARHQGEGTWDHYSGLLDEVRISSVPRSAAWVKFEYYNQSSASHEISVGEPLFDNYGEPGAGESLANPYRITSCQQLQNMSTDLDAYYVLTRNINCSMTNPEGVGFNANGTWGDEKGFNPVGYYNVTAHPFTGNFDGRGYTISNLYINRPDQNEVGLFGRVNSGGTIKNFNLENVDITAGGFVGAVVGYTTTPLFNISVSGEVTGGGRVGMVIGFNEGTRTVNGYSFRKLSSSGTVYVLASGGAGGGLIGMLYGEGSVLADSYSTADVLGGSGSSMLGGLVGMTWGGPIIERTYASGNVGPDEGGVSVSKVGGLVGDVNINGSGGSIFQSFATGTVSGDSDVGGLVGTVTNAPDGGLSAFIDDSGSLGFECVGGVEVQQYGCSDGNPGWWTGGTALNASPTAYWDFSSIWKVVSGNFPAFVTNSIELVSPPTPTANEILAQDFAEIKIQTIDPTHQHYVLNNFNDSLVGWWRGEGNFNDESSYENDGTLEGATYAEGKFGQAFSFDGNDYADVSSNAAFRSIDNITLSAWVKPSESGAGWKTIIANQWDYDDRSGILVSMDGTTGKVHVAVSNGGGIDSINGEASVKDGSWHLVTVKFSSGIIKIYIDGVLDKTYSTDGINSIDYSANDLVIGKNSEADYEYWTGLIDDVAIFNRALSENEILALYDASVTQYDNTFANLMAGASFTDVAYAVDLDGGKISTTERSFVRHSAFDGGSGTYGDPWQISTCQQLQVIGSSEDYLDDFYVLVPSGGGDDDDDDDDVSDTIDCSMTNPNSENDNFDSETWDSAGFDPIGTEEHPFTGGFNGNGKTITGLFINRDETDYVGLFGYVAPGQGEGSGSIHDVNLTGVNVTGFYRVGGLVGKMLSGTQVVSSTVAGTVNGVNYIGGLVGGSLGLITESRATNITINGQNFVGGLVGGLSGTEGDNGRILDSSSSGTVNGGSEEVGGLVGVITNYGEVDESSSTANVLGNWTIGGLVGTAQGSVTNSHARGAVTSQYGYAVGGLIGYLQGGQVSNSYATGNVSAHYADFPDVEEGSTYAGGLVGMANSGSIHESYATGDVIGLGSRVGGLVGGTNDSVENCYATGDVTSGNPENSYIGGSRVGGLVGGTTGYIYNSYAIGNVRGFDAVGGLIGYSGRAYIENSFSAGMVTGDGTTGGFVGLFSADPRNGEPGDEGIANGIWNSAYDYSEGFDCYSYDSEANGYFSDNYNCTAIDTGVSYFYDPANVPMMDDNWDFRQVWAQNASTFPTLRAIEADDIVSDVYVKSDWTEESYGEGLVWGSSAFNDIQAAVDFVAAGGRVHLLDSTDEDSDFELDSTVNVTKSMTIVGDELEEGKVNIYNSSCTGSIFNIQSSNVTVENIEMSSGGLDDCESNMDDMNTLAKQISIGSSAEDAVAITNITVSDDNFLGGEVGLFVYPSSSNVNVSSNYFSGNYIATWLSAPDVSVTDNEFFENFGSVILGLPYFEDMGDYVDLGGVVISGNSIHSGLMGIYYMAGNQANDKRLTIGGATMADGNDIYENEMALTIQGDSHNVFVTHNKIHDNSIGSMITHDTTGVDATINWWGDATGPQEAVGNPEGLGNAVYIDDGASIDERASNFVNYRPFCIDDTCEHLSTYQAASDNLGTLFSNGGTMTVPGADPGDYSSITEVDVLENTVVTIPVTEVDDTIITLPAGTVIKRHAGEGEANTFNAGLLTATEETLGQFSGFGDGLGLVGAFEWGIPNLGLEFVDSEGDPSPITIDMYVGTDLAGRTLTVKRSTSMDGGWTQDGLLWIDADDGRNGTCLVSGDGVCSFRTTLASYYVAGAPGVTSSGGGGGGVILHKKVAKGDVIISKATHKFVDMVIHWANVYAEDLYGKGVINGYENDTLFKPNANITRAEFTKLIVKMMHLTLSIDFTKTLFTDVKITDWYAPYLEAAAKAGIANGYNDKTFKPNANITRAEAMKILVLAKEKGDLPAYENTFPDVLATDWFAKYVGYAVKKGIVGGYSDKTFKPDAPITRAEAAKIVDLMMK